MKLRTVASVAFMCMVTSAVFVLSASAQSGRRGDWGQDFDDDSSTQHACVNTRSSMVVVMDPVSHSH